jgi:group I intron endonuclease
VLIYKATNILNGKSYIGKTVKTMESRKARHKREAEKDYYTNSLFHRAIRKYGFGAFQWQELTECIDEADLNYMETFMIVSHCTHMSDGGYNMTWGGTGGDTWSGCLNREERARKISEANKGKKRTPEQNKKQSEIRTGEKHKSFSEEARKNMSKARTGRRLSEESKRKIGDKHKGKIYSEESKRKMAISNRKYSDAEANQMFLLRKQGFSLRSISKQLGIPFTSVVWCLKSWTKWGNSNVTPNA